MPPATAKLSLPVMPCSAVGDGVAAAGNGQLVLDTTPWPAWASMVRFPEPLRG